MSAFYRRETRSYHVHLFPPFKQPPQVRGNNAIKGRNDVWNMWHRRMCFFSSSRPCPRYMKLRSSFRFSWEDLENLQTELCSTPLLTLNYRFSQLRGWRKRKKLLKVLRENFANEEKLYQITCSQSGWRWGSPNPSRNETRTTQNNFLPLEPSRFQNSSVVCQKFVPRKEKKLLLFLFTERKCS